MRLHERTVVTLTRCGFKGEQSFRSRSARATRASAILRGTIQLNRALHLRLKEIPARHRANRCGRQRRSPPRGMGNPALAVPPTVRHDN